MLTIAVRSGLSFVGCFLILFGAVGLIAHSLEVLARPMEALPAWTLYHLDFRGSPTEFYLGCFVVSVGFTLLLANKD